MKISKKQAIKFACIEEEIRNGDEWNTFNETDPIGIQAYVLREKSWEPWVKHAPSMIATMLYDRVFPFQDRGRTTNPKAITPFKRKFGARLWNAGVTAYLLEDHDT